MEGNFSVTERCSRYQRVQRLGGIWRERHCAAIGRFGILTPIHALIDQPEVIRQITVLRSQLHRLLIAADGVLIVARFHIRQREIMQGVRPVRSLLRRIAERRKRLHEIGLLEIGDSQRVVAVSLAWIDADGLLEQVRRLAVLLVVQEAAALEERIAAFEIERCSN